MRGLLLLVVLLTVSGCRKNQDLLQARQAELDERLVEAMAIADTLNDERREVDALEVRVKTGLEEVPAAREAVVAIKAEPGEIAVRFPREPLPPESAFEGSEGARRRLRIAETERRIEQLRRIVHEVSLLRAEKIRLQRQLETIDGLRQQPK
jgi:hypothetical protein